MKLLLKPLKNEADKYYALVVDSDTSDDRIE